MLSLLDKQSDRTRFPRKADALPPTTRMSRLGFRNYLHVFGVRFQFAPVVALGLLLGALLAVIAGLNLGALLGHGHYFRVSSMPVS